MQRYSCVYTLNEYQINPDGWLERSNLFLACSHIDLAVLLEADVSSLFTEALTREVDAIFANEGITGASNAARARALTVTAWGTEPNVLVSHLVSKRNVPCSRHVDEAAFFTNTLSPKITLNSNTKNYVIFFGTLMAVHRPTLKKKQKAFKTRHSSKGSIKDENKGRIAGHKSGLKGGTLSKHDRRNLSNQLKAVKQSKAYERTKIFDGRHGVPKNVVIVPLTDDIDSTAVGRRLIEVSEGEVDPDIPNTAWISRFRQRLRFFLPSYGSFYEMLDAARGADFVVFALSAEKEIDDYGEQVIRCIASQGVTTSLGVVQNLSQVSGGAKRQTQIRQSLSSWFSHFFAGEKIISVDNPSETQNCIRTLCQKSPRGINWRDERPWLVIEKAEVNADSQTLAVEGFVRGKPLSPSHLLHLVTYGDLAVESIREVPVGNAGMDVDPQNWLPENTQSLDPLCEESVELHDPDQNSDKGINVIGHSYITESMTKDLANNQPLKSKPRGVSDYQATWMLEGEDYRMDSDDEVEEPNELLSDEEGELIEEDGNDEAGEMELDQEVDDAELNEAREQREQQDELDFPDEIELDPRESGKARLSRYRGILDFKSAEWDPNEKDLKTPAEFTRLARPENTTAVGNHIRKEIEGFGAPVGTRVIVELRGNRSFESINPSKLTSSALYGLLPGEQKLATVSTSFNLDSEFTEPLKSKSELLMQHGPRRLIVNPLFSQSGHHDNDIYKLHRLIHLGLNASATMMAPLFFGNAPVVYFSPSPSEPRIVGTGSLIDTDSDRVIVKTAILTGFPVKIHRKLVTVRYMLFNSEDISWFQAVPLFTKSGAHGFIKEALGTHGNFKATFDRKIKAQDVIAMALYKREWPQLSRISAF